MEFHQIRYFLAVCDRMSFTRAADACAVSQPALTKAIRKLEDELGGPLFIRDRRRLQLTELGRVMRAQLAKIEETREAARRAARAVIDLDMAELNIGIMCTIGPNILGPALAAFQAANRGVELVLHDVWAKRAHELLLSGALDCALLGRHGPLPPRFAAEPLFTEPIVVAMAPDHRLAAKGELTTADFRGEPYLDRLRCEFREEFFALLEGRMVAVDIVLRSEREDWIQSAIAAGLGLSLIPRHSVVNPALAVRRLDDVRPERGVEIVSVQGRPRPPALASLIAFLKDHRWPASPLP